MELRNEFTVKVPVERAWVVLTDVERIAPCMPGAELQEIEGDEYRGVVKVRVGPITAQYKGTASFEERDDAAHRAVLRAEGRDTRGQGNASALITAHAEATDDGGTRVTVDTDLTVTGRVAQFGRGVMSDVSAKLMREFVECLERDLLSGDGDAAASTAGGGAREGGAAGSTGEAAAAAAAALGSDEPVDTTAPVAEHASSSGTAATGPGAATGEAPSVRRVDGPSARPVDLLETAGASVAKRAAPVAAVTLLAALFLGLRRRRRRRRRR